MEKAENNISVFKKLYPFPEYPESKIILEPAASIKGQYRVFCILPKIPGVSLSSLTSVNTPENQQILEKLLRKYYPKEKFTNEIIGQLEKYEIYPHDLNLGNILYDSQTEKLYLIDFDESRTLIDKRDLEGEPTNKLSQYIPIF